MKVHHYSKALSWITRPRVTETATAETYTPELERMNFKPEKSKADQYKEYLKAEPFLEPESQIYARDQLGFDEGGSAQLVQPGQPGVRQGYGIKPATPEQKRRALELHGKPWKDLTVAQRTKIRVFPTSILQKNMYGGISLEPYLDQIKELYLKGWSAADILEANPDWEKKYRWNIKKKQGVGIGGIKRAIVSMKTGESPVKISKSEMATRPTLAKTLNEAFDKLKKKLKRPPMQRELREKTGISYKGLRNLSSDRVLSEGRAISGGKKGSAAAKKYFKERKVDKPTRVQTGVKGDQTVTNIKFKDANQEKKYLGFLEERLKYPQASKRNPYTNAFFRKEFGISDDTIHSTNRWLADKHKLKYPKRDPKEGSRIRGQRIAEGQKFVGGERYANINKGQELIRDKVNDYYKKYPKQILKNKKLIDALNLKLIDGKVVSKNKTAEELISAAQRENGILDIEHIKGVKTEARNIEFPINRQLAPYNVNSGFLQSVDTYLTKNVGSTDPMVQKNIANIEKTLKNFGWRINIDGQILGAKLIPAVDPTKQVLPNVLKNIKSMGIKLPGALKVLGLGAAGTLAATTLASAEEAQAGETGIAEKAKSWPIEHPWLTGAGATGAAATTKPGRSLLGKTFRTLGTPLAGLGWAGYTAYDNLKSGKSLTESVVDPLVGMELTFPSMFKENLSKITKSPTLQKVLGLGKFGSRFMPGVGTAITLGSLSRDSVIAINKEAKRIDAIEDPDQQAEEQEIFIRNIKGYAGGGLTRTVGDYDNYLPDIDDID